MAALSFPRRGEIYWVALDPTFGAEIAKTRPGLIISNDVANQYSGLVIVASLSSTAVHQVQRFQVLVKPEEAGLDRPSKVLLNQIRTVDKRWLGMRTGSLSEDRMAEVDRAIGISLALKPSRYRSSDVWPPGRASRLSH